MELEEKQLTSEVIFDGCVVHLRRDTVRLPDGSSSVREIIRHDGAVCVLPLTEQGEVVLIRQYRYAVGQTLVEIPAGKRDGTNEPPRDAARRELLEETGIEADELIDLGVYYGSPAIMGERIDVYLARGLHFGKAKPDEGELLEVFTLPLEQAVEQVMRGEIPDGKTQLAILKTVYYLKKEGNMQ